MSDCLPRKGDMIRKKLHWLFNKFRFKLASETNLKITDYLHVTVNHVPDYLHVTVNHVPDYLHVTVNHVPFRKNNQYSCYINVGSKPSLTGFQAYS